jgi:hypothetical protein
VPVSILFLGSVSLEISSTDDRVEQLTLLLLGRAQRIHIAGRNVALDALAHRPPQIQRRDGVEVHAIALEPPLACVLPSRLVGRVGICIPSGMERSSASTSLARVEKIGPSSEASARLIVPSRSS